jgi:hypothetical protein
MAMRRGKGKKADEVVEAVGKGLKAVGKKTARAVTRRNPSMAKQIADKGLKTSIKTPAKSKSSTAFQKAAEKAKIDITKSDAAAARAQKAKENKNRILRNTRSQVRRVEVKDKIANDPAYNSYRQEKQGIRPPTKSEQKVAGRDSKKIEGGMRSSFDKQRKTQDALREQIKSEKNPAAKRRLRQRLNSHIQKHGRY